MRDTHGTDAKNPFAFEHVRARIEHGLREFEGRFIVVPLPNITHIFYGRDVGYTIERIELDPATEQVSATTQETSASAQQIASSAQELSATAETLEQLVSRFRLTV